MGDYGQTLVLLSVLAASIGSVVALGTAHKPTPWARQLVDRLCYAYAALMFAANGVMIAALVTHDFSVKYVAQVGSRATPLHITIVSLWSSLEGSILFWGAVLGGYIAAFVYAQRRRQAGTMLYAEGILLAVGLFFAYIIAGPADPFPTVSPVPDDGPGPNPLLQNHPLMIIHPPALYLGYVGMAVPFAIACAALLSGKMSDGWLRVLRTWTMAPWLALSIGIILGGWWAYEVLGWGGYWAWDPVENASFLPWLAATGYLHSTVVQERRRILKAWTLSLVLAAFALTILGTFMTRSGIFNSVHSFTQSDIGPIFLAFLGVVLVFSVGLLSGRAHLLEPEGQISSWLSRESAFLANNLLLVLFTFTVLLGTVFPLATEALRGVKISVGEPYFDRLAVPIGLSLLFLMGVGPSLPWGEPDRARLRRDLLIPTGFGLACVGVSLLLGATAPSLLATVALSGFAAFVTIRELVLPGLERARRRSEGFGTAWLASLRGNRRRVGGYVVHLGIILIALAIAGSSHYRLTEERSMMPGETMRIGEYTLTYTEPRQLQEPHLRAIIAAVEVQRDGDVVQTLYPRQNFYATQREPIATPHVKTMGLQDLYLSLVAFEPDSHRASIRAYVIPMVPVLWGSMPFLVVGSVWSLWPRRRKKWSAP